MWRRSGPRAARLASSDARRPSKGVEHSRAAEFQFQVRGPDVEMKTVSVDGGRTRGLSRRGDALVIALEPCAFTAREDEGRA